jgi:ketosteroid isomerase-like protein
MMSKINLLKKLLSSIENENIKEAGECLTDDFMFSGPTPEPIGKNQFLQLHQELVSAIPDWRFNATDFREKEDTLLLTVHVSGTHTTNSLNLPQVGLTAIHATGKHFALPAEAVEIQFRDDRIAQFKVAVVPNGGLMGILKQLGIEIPVPAGV